MSLQKFIEAGFPKRPPAQDRYMKLLTPYDDEELSFWEDEPTNVDRPG